MKAKTSIVVNLKNLEHNTKIIRQYAPNKQIQAVVKANAYGHGEIEIAKHLERIGIKNFGVARLEEGVILRKNGILGSILVLGGVHSKKELLLADEYKLDLTIYSFENYKFLKYYTNTLSLSLDFTLKLDTGMHRLGIQETELRKIDFSNLKITGFMSHFLDAGNKESYWSKKQIDIFRKAINFVIQKNKYLKYIHIENTAGFFNYGLPYTNLARIGIGLYGYGNPNLKPILSLQSYIKDIKKLHKGETTSYGGWYKAKNDMRIAIIPVGYGDGFLRANRTGTVFVNGKLAPILSVICMDYFMIDISKIPNTQIGDRVEIIGESHNANYWAKTSGTIVYEVLTSLNPRIPRTFNA